MRSHTFFVNTASLL